LSILAPAARIGYTRATALGAIQQGKAATMKRYFQDLHKKVQTWQIEYNSSFGKDISTQEARKSARRHANIVDHAFLRRVWTNMYPLGDRAWRSNQPGPTRFDRLAQIGIKSIINLRGPSAFAVYLFEVEACEKYQIPLYDHEIDAYTLNSAETYLSLLDLFASVQKPVLMHCKSGADRAGLASALYLIDQEGVPVEQAKAQLALKHAHRKNSKAGILDHFLAGYEADNRQNPQSLRDWLGETYDRDALIASFQAAREK